MKDAKVHNNPVPQMNELYEMLTKKVHEKQSAIGVSVFNKRSKCYIEKPMKDNKSVYITQLNRNFVEEGSIRISKENFMKNNQFDNQTFDLLVQAIAEQKDILEIAGILNIKEHFNANLIRNDIDGNHQEHSQNLQRNRDQSSSFHLFNDNSINNEINNNNQINNENNMRREQNIVFEDEHNVAINNRNAISCNYISNDNGCAVAYNGCDIF